MTRQRCQMVDTGLPGRVTAGTLGPRASGIFGLALFIGLGACSPTVKVEPPDRPIEINLNVKIEQEVRIRIDRDLEELFDENDAIF